jgi:ubiquinone/menaquinone biosynthesis C-methylase UbiE
MRRIEESSLGDSAIADIGCGDPAISKRFANVVSYDLYPIDESVIEASHEKIPVDDGVYDVVVCSLCMMTGYISKAVLEMNRILKIGGIWYFGEVRSRIKSIKCLVSKIEKVGFESRSVDTRNTHFVIMEFTKTRSWCEKDSIPEIRLKACLYKKR